MSISTINRLLVLRVKLLGAMRPSTPAPADTSQNPNRLEFIALFGRNRARFSAWWGGMA